MKPVAAAILGLALGAFPAAAHVADGIWALTPEDCELGFEPGKLVIDVAEGFVAYYGADCVIERWDAIGTEDAAWRAKLSCGGEGGTRTVNAIFALDVPFTVAPLRLIEIDLDNGNVVGRYGCGGPER